MTCRQYTASMFDARKLNVVVIQEQSQIPAVPDLVATEMLPAATQLAARAREIGAQPVLRRRGGAATGGPKSGSRRTQRCRPPSRDGYAMTADALDVDVAPVGRRRLKR
jgi:hypothetical protein